MSPPSQVDPRTLALLNWFWSISHETAQFRQFEKLLVKFPIYTEYLRDVPGIGPAMAAVLMAGLDPAKAERISSCRT
jgi:hypothetical protein